MVGSKTAVSGSSPFFMRISRTSVITCDLVTGLDLSVFVVVCVGFTLLPIGLLGVVSKRGGGGGVNSIFIGRSATIGAAGGMEAWDEITGFISTLILEMKSRGGGGGGAGAGVRMMCCWIC